MLKALTLEKTSIARATPTPANTSSGRFTETSSRSPGAKTSRAATAIKKKKQIPFAGTLNEYELAKEETKNAPIPAKAPNVVRDARFLNAATNIYPTPAISHAKNNPPTNPSSHNICKYSLCAFGDRLCDHLKHWIVRMGR